MSANRTALTMRHQMRKPKRKRLGRKTAPMTSVVQRSARGDQIIALPNSLCQSLDWRAGRRIWFQVQAHGVALTTKPWGPYPRKGRRICNRIRVGNGPQVKPSQSMRRDGSP